MELYYDSPKIVNLDKSGYIINIGYYAIFVLDVKIQN